MRTSPPAAAVESANAPADFWLPDFCSPSASQRLVIIALAVALLLLTAQAPVLWPFPWRDLFLLAVISGGVIAVSFALICRWRARMAHLGHTAVASLCVGLIMFNTAWMSYAGLGLLQALGLPTLSFMTHEASLLARNVLIAGLFASLFMHYLMLQARLRERERSALQARLEALQARIQPHFLFNSMNIIASLIAVDPGKAEQAVEDLATLFRASLRDVLDVSLAEELALCRRYANIEQLRLDDRLAIDWRIPPGVEQVRIPPLTLQPLLENAIRHGVELSAVRCDITLTVSLTDTAVEIVLVNPLPGVEPRAGNRMSLHNVTERLKARFGPAASLQTEAAEGFFVTRLAWPL